MSRFQDAYARMPRGYRYAQTYDGVGIFSFPAFAQTNIVRHGFSARTGGVSRGSCASLNLSFTRPNDPQENVLENYHRLAEAADISYDSMVMDNYEHGIQVLAVDAAHRGCGYLSPPLPPCDGLITQTPAITLVTGHADCVPLFLLDTAGHSIGLAHAGWKGTLGKIGLHAARMMMEQFHAKPESLLAGVGPCICQNCFEVDASLADQFADAFPGVPLVAPGKIPQKAQLDLVMASAAQFLEAGIPAENISLMMVCTFEDARRLYSHRRDAGDTGGMSAFMQLLPYSSSAHHTAYLRCPTPAKKV